MFLYVMLRHNDISPYFRSIHKCPRDFVGLEEKFDCSCEVLGNQEIILGLNFN